MIDSSQTLVAGATRRKFLWVASLALGATVVGCGGGSAESAPEPATGGPPPAPAPGPAPVPSPPSPAPPPGSATGYTTSFDTSETPLSEGGAWVRRATAWKAVAARSGHVGPSANVGSHFDDCYAHVSGFGADQQVEATIYKGAATGGEVELLLRVTDTATTVSCYECLFNVGGGVEIVRWNGPLDDFTYIGNVLSTPSDARDGDKLRARIVGQSIEFFYIPGGTGTPQLIATATDTSAQRLTSGDPGIAFFQRSPGSLDYGFKDFSATAL